VFETGKTVHFEARLAVDDGDVGRVVDSGEEVRYEPSVSTDRVTSAYPVFRRGQGTIAYIPTDDAMAGFPTDSPSVLIYIVS